MKTIITIILLGMSLPSLSQDKSAIVESIWQAYNQLDYDQATSKAQAALKNYQGLTPEQITELHEVLAFIYFSEDKLSLSRQHFESAISLTPSLELDSLYVSPIIINFFNQLKHERDLKQSESENATSTVRYLVIRDPRPPAVIRSLVLPGWGQLYKGEKSKGIVFSGLWGLGVIGSVVAHFGREGAHNRYLSATGQSEFDSRYDTFKTWHKARNSLLLFSAGVWAVTFADALLTGKPTEPNAMDARSKPLSVLPAISPQSARITFAVAF